MTARELLFAVSTELRKRGHNVMLGLGDLYVEQQLVARVVPVFQIRVTAAEVFDGHKHVVPKGCNAATFTPGARGATVERIADAVEHRMTARARSLPVPQDPGAIVREP